MNTDSDVVNILTWQWSDYPKIRTISKSIANMFRFFRTAKQGIHISPKGDVPVIRVRNVTSAAMDLLLDYLEENAKYTSSTIQIPRDLNDSYFFAALPDLYMFLKKGMGLSDDEYFGRTGVPIYSLQTAVIDKMRFAIANPTITSDAELIHQLKILLVKYHDD